MFNRPTSSNFANSHNSVNILSTHSSIDNTADELTVVASHNLSNKNREIWIDIIRGITILLVIYSHLVIENEIPSKLNLIFMTTRMPLFFFISGFFIYSVDYDSILLWKRLKNRLKKQLYPTIILFSLYIIIFYHCNFLKVFDEYKVGYWFTYVSVMYFLTLAPLLWFFSKLNIKNYGRILILLLLMAGSTIVQYIFAKLNFYQSDISRLLSFSPYIYYFRFITCGCLFRILWNIYNTRLINWYAFIISIIGFIICYNGNNIISKGTPFFGIYIMLFVVNKLSIYINSNNKIIKWLSFTGTMTLEIYLLHYFILSSIIWNSRFFDDIRILAINTVWEFPFFLSISILVALICLISVKILRQVKLNKLIFAKK